MHIPFADHTGVTSEAVPAGKTGLLNLPSRLSAAIWQPRHGRVRRATSQERQRYLAGWRSALPTREVVHCDLTPLSGLTKERAAQQPSQIDAGPEASLVGHELRCEAPFELRQDWQAKVAIHCSANLHWLPHPQLGWGALGLALH